MTLNYLKFAAKGFFLGTQERGLNSRGKRVISARATEDLLYVNDVTENLLSLTRLIADGSSLLFSASNPRDR